MVFYEHNITCVAVTSNGLCVSGSKDHTLRVWDLRYGKCLHTLSGHKRFVTYVTVNQGGMCISKSCDNIIRVWDLSTGKCLHTIELLDLNVPEMNLTKAIMDKKLKSILSLNGVVI